MRRGRRVLWAGVLVGVISFGYLTGVLGLVEQAYERFSASTEIDAGQRRWNGQGVDSYEIVVRRMDATWHIQWNTVVVRNGEVTEHSARCIPAPAGPNPCEVRPFDPAEFTVTGLFETARSLLGREDPETVAFRFDGTYGYPRAISSDRPALVDDQQGWAVESFTPL